MKTTLLQKIMMILFVFFFSISKAQVGINTTTPAGGSILDVTGTDKGILVPRVNIVDLNTIAPVTGGTTESLLVYNTNTTTGKGFYYWDSIRWVPIGTDNDDWNILGNTATDEDINFIGTTDGQGLTVRTNNAQRFRFNTNNQLLAMSNGSAAAPSYSWSNDTTMGFYRSGTSQMDMVINGVSFYNANANIAPSENEWTFNPGGLDSNLRVETDNNANALFVDGANDNVGLGTNAPNLSAQMEMADINKGLLINRIALTATNVATPISSPATGLLVYNTATASSGSTAVTPGFYYWDGAKWVALDGTNGRDWSLEGNAGTNPTTNFLGTTDDTDFVLRTNNTERMRFANTGVAGIGAVPYSNVALRVSNSVQPFGVIGETNSNGASIYGIQAGPGFGLRGDSYSTGYAIYGENAGTGIGIVGYAVSSHGIYGTTPYTGGTFLTAGTVGWGYGDNNANGMLAVTDKVPTATSNIGIRAVSGTTTSVSTSDVLNIGVNSNATNLALYALSEGPITSVGDIEAARFQSNYTGNSYSADARDPRAQLAGYAANGVTPLGTANTYYGAYLYSGGVSSNASYAYAGARHGGVNYKIIGNGTVSTIVDGLNNSDTKKVMFAPEAPEVLFEDYGSGKLNNGTATINIDPIFSKNIIVNSEHPLRVFIQLEGDCNGVYVTNKSATGFTVKELQNGNSNISFSWHIVANRKNETTNDGVTMYENLRFPDAPSAILPKENVVTKIKEEKTKKTERFVDKK